MSKRLARMGLACGLNVTGALARAERQMRVQLAVLCYHRILSPADKSRYFKPDLVVTPETFRQQCRLLAERFDVVTMREAVADGGRRTNPRKPLAAITFDDGYEDNYSHAAPILETCGLRATFYVVAGLIGTEQAPWYDRLARACQCLERQQRLDSVILDTRDLWNKTQLHANMLSAATLVTAAKQLSPEDRARAIDRFVQSAGENDDLSARDRLMTWSQLQELERKGHEIGAHSLTHEILPLLDDEALVRETQQARETLQRQLKTPVVSFCYPNGSVDERTAQAVRRAGYTNAVTVNPGNNDTEQDVYLLNRWFIHEDRLRGPWGFGSDAILRMELTGLRARLRHG